MNASYEKDKIIIDFETDNFRLKFHKIYLKRFSEKSRVNLEKKCGILRRLVNFLFKQLVLVEKLANFLISKIYSQIIGA